MLDKAVLDLLRASPVPLSSDEILERLPAEALHGVFNARQKLRSILLRPEIGHSERGRHVYLPARITGSTLRLPLTAGPEEQEGLFFFPADLSGTFWFRKLSWGAVQGDVSGTLVLPDGTESRLAIRYQLRNGYWHFGTTALVSLGEAAVLWLWEQEYAAGDSLLVRFLDGESGRAALTLERRADRDDEQVAARNRDLADTAEAILIQDLRGKSLFPQDLTGWLLARGFYQHPVSPDPIEIVTDRDRRFTMDEDGKLVRATRWDWVRQREEETLFAEDAEEREEWVRGLSRVERWMVLGMRLPEALQPWMDAVGYPAPDNGNAAETAAREAAIAVQREQVFRLNRSPNQRYGTWWGRKCSPEAASTCATGRC